MKWRVRRSFACGSLLLAGSLHSLSSEAPPPCTLSAVIQFLMSSADSGRREGVKEMRCRREVGGRFKVVIVLVPLCRGGRRGPRRYTSEADAASVSTSMLCHCSIEVSLV
eukprot:10523_2